jgi:hypothetical protein
VYYRPPGTIARADDVRWKGGFTFVASSGNEYTIAFDAAGGYWVCSCKGGIHHGHCKHLQQFGRPGRTETERMANAETRELASEVEYQARKRDVLPVKPRFEPPPANAAPLPGKLLALPVRKRALALDGDI